MTAVITSYKLSCESRSTLRNIVLWEQLDDFKNRLLLNYTRNYYIL